MGDSQNHVIVVHLVFYDDLLSLAKHNWPVCYVLYNVVALDASSRSHRDRPRSHRLAASREHLEPDGFLNGPE